MSTLDAISEAARTRFEQNYITAPQIADYVGVTRVAVMNARVNGSLPGGFEVARTFLWERRQIQPHIDAWRERVMYRLGVAA